MKISQILKYSLLGIRPKLPVSLILLVTARCNSRCEFCFFKERINQNVSELSLDEIKNLSRSLKRLNRIIISGGEPFLRQDIVEICKTFFINNKLDELSIPTNGLAPKLIAETSEKILMECPGVGLMVSISVDGPPELNNKIRGVRDSYYRTKETYEKLAELKKKYPRFRVHVTTTISKYNYSHLDELIDLIKKDMPELNGHNFEFIRSEHSIYCPDLPPLKECFDFGQRHRVLVEQANKHFSMSWIKSAIAKPTNNYKFDFLLNILKNKKQSVRCLAGEMIGMINEVGDVFLCELLPAVGNIRKTSFEEVWRSPEAEEQRKMIAQKKCWCTHSCFQGTNILYQPKNYFKIIKYFIK